MLILGRQICGKSQPSAFGRNADSPRDAHNERLGHTGKKDELSKAIIIDTIEKVGAVWEVNTKPMFYSRGIGVRLQRGTGSQADQKRRKRVKSVPCCTLGGVD
jgi:hypothetical protein